MDATRPQDAGAAENHGNRPFAISIAGFLSRKDYTEALTHIRAAGADAVRFMSNAEWGALVWGEVEPEKGRFVWSEPDEHYLEAQERGLDVMVNIYPINEWDAPDIDPVQTADGPKIPMHYPNDMEEYLKFVRMAAERYDGDGKEDADGSPKVGTWILGTEMEGLGRWQGTPQQYAVLFVKTYAAIKDANPSATLMTYGANILQNQQNGDLETFTRPMLRKLRDETLDLQGFSFTYAIHCYPRQEQFVSQYLDAMASARALLDAEGFSDIPIGLTDLGLFYGKDDPSAERRLATIVVKSYVLGLARGLTAIVWAQLSDASHGSTVEAGLISPDGSGTYYRNLSYYSYRLTAEKLQGIKQDEIRILDQGEAFLLEFQKQEGKLWVAWAEGPATKQVVISGIGTSRVLLTHAVPDAASGKDLAEDDYPGCFEAESRAVDSGRIAIRATNEPVFIEEE